MEHFNTFLSTLSEQEDKICKNNDKLSNRKNKHDLVIYRELCT